MDITSPYWIVFLIVLFIGNTVSAVINYSDGNRTAGFKSAVLAGFLALSIVLCFLRLFKVL